MKLKDITDKSFISGPLAMTDIHNGGSLFGVIYHQILVFKPDGTVSLKSEIDYHSGMNWDKSIRESIWEGTYHFDSEMKHVECQLTGQKSMRIFADLVKSTYLLCEVYLEGEEISQSRVFLLK